jgi:signal transduction histidine kinase
MTSAPQLVVRDEDVHGHGASGPSQMEQHIHRELARAEVLAHVAARLNAQLDLETVLSVVCEETAHALNVPLATVALYDSRTDTLCPIRGFDLLQEHDQPMPPVPRAVYEQIVQQQGSIVVIPDLQALLDLPHARLDVREKARTLIFASMLREGQLVGTLAAVTVGQVRSFGEDERSLLQGLADQAALAISNARLFEDVRRELAERKQAEEQIKRLGESLERRANELAALNKASQAVVSTLDFESVLKLVIGEVRSLLDTEAASVLLRDPSSDDLVFAAVAGFNELVGTRMPIVKGIAGWVMQNRQPALVQDAQSDSRFYPGVDQRTGLITRSVIAVPLRFRGAVWGVVETINKVGGAFSEGDVELMEALARSAAIALVNAQSYQAEHELRKLVEQSRVQLAQSEKLAATGRLAATFAHEVNNPLQAIYNCLQMMRDFQLKPEEQRECLQIAISEVERLTGTVSRVLDLTRRPQQEMRPVQLNQVVERVLALTGKYLQHRHVALQKDLASDLPLTLALPDELVQVFLNLVLNAADAMPEGGMLRVTSRLAEDGRLAVALSDTGCGIPPENLDRIFEPFFSTKEGGTGMGLNISSDVIKHHGGEIMVESQVGRGTTFTVCLPRVAGRG